MNRWLSLLPALMLANVSLVAGSSGPRPSTGLRFVEPRLYAYETPKLLVRGEACPGSEVVRVALHVSAAGRVQEAELLQPAQNAGLNAALLSAVKTFRYQARITDWRPQAFTTAYQFVMHPRGCRAPAVSFPNGITPASPPGDGRWLRSSPEPFYGDGGPVSECAPGQACVEQ